MSKFKVGDKVRILDGSNIKNYTAGWYRHMSKSVGEVDTICDSRVIKENMAYRLEGHRYWWDERGLELVAEPWAVIIEPTFDTTTVGKLYCGGKLVKEVSTKKHPDDEYNRDEAIRVICERLVGEKKEEPKKLYNGKVVCVANPKCDAGYTVGKIYTFNDGEGSFNDGIRPLLREPFATFEEFTSWSSAKWIEVVEE